MKEEKFKSGLFNGIDIVVMRVKDINSSKRWYEEKLRLNKIQSNVYQ
jgi:catechol 2,3-dioxygenase-like lactoylglutathione lyase family enzyme